MAGLLEQRHGAFRGGGRIVSVTQQEKGPGAPHVSPHGDPDRSAAELVAGDLGQRLRNPAEIVNDGRSAGGARR